MSKKSDGNNQTATAFLCHYRQYHAVLTTPLQKNHPTSSNRERGDINVPGYQMVSSLSAHPSVTSVLFGGHAGPRKGFSDVR